MDLPSRLEQGRQNYNRLCAIAAQECAHGAPYLATRIVDRLSQLAERLRYDACTDSDMVAQVLGGIDPERAEQYLRDGGLLGRIAGRSVELTRPFLPGE